jgi:hypothetical protein
MIQLSMMTDQNAANRADETHDCRENLTVPAVQKGHMRDLNAC